MTLGSVFGRQISGVSFRETDFRGGGGGRTSEPEGDGVKPEAMSAYYPNHRLGYHLIWYHAEPYSVLETLNLNPPTYDDEQVGAFHNFLFR